jgi:hypothetical protein
MFTANPSDLSDAIAYELQAIDYVRGTLSGQSEAADGGTSVVLGDLRPDGMLRRDLRMICRAGFSGGEAVRSSLGRFRPLAFSAAFKIQDMVAEWILRANGENEWAFRKKLSAYDRLRIQGLLSEPPLFSGNMLLAHAFWELYRFLVPFRGTVVHSGGVKLDVDGTVSVTKGPQTIHFSPTEQSSYMRAVCLIAKILSDQLSRNDYLERMIEGDLSELEKYHSQAGLALRHDRYEAITAHVPPSLVLEKSPLCVRVDFSQLRRTMEETHPADTGGKLFFAVRVEAVVETSRYVWQLPVEAVPDGLANLSEGDGRYDKFLQISPA